MIRPRGVALAGILIVGAGALVIPFGPVGGNRTALAALTAGSAGSDQGGPAAAEIATGPAPEGARSTASASSLDALTGSAGIDPVDLIGKGVVVAALLYLTLRALRRLQAGPSGGSRLMEVIETRPLGPKASLHLVAIGERRLVVGLSPGGMVAIADLEAAELPEPVIAASVMSRVLLGADRALTTAGAPAGLRTVARDAWLLARRMVAGGAVATPRAHDDRTVGLPGEGR